MLVWCSVGGVVYCSVCLFVCLFFFSCSSGQWWCVVFSSCLFLNFLLFWIYYHCPEKKKKTIGLLITDIRWYVNTSIYILHVIWLITYVINHTIYDPHLIVIASAQSEFQFCRSINSSKVQYGAPDQVLI